MKAADYKASQAADFFGIRRTAHSTHRECCRRWLPHRTCGQLSNGLAPDPL